MSGEELLIPPQTGSSHSGRNALSREVRTDIQLGAAGMLVRIEDQIRRLDPAGSGTVEQSKVGSVHSLRTDDPTHVVRRPELVPCGVS